MRIEGAGNLIVGNSCAGNAALNYQIAADSRYGPIVNISTSGTPAVNGSSAAGTLTATDPLSNISY